MEASTGPFLLIKVVRKWILRGLWQGGESFASLIVFSGGLAADFGTPKPQPDLK